MDSNSSLIEDDFTEDEPLDSDPPRGPSDFDSLDLGDNLSTPYSRSPPYSDGPFAQPVAGDSESGLEGEEDEEAADSTAFPGSSDLSNSELDPSLDPSLDYSSSSPDSLSSSPPTQQSENFHSTDREATRRRIESLRADFDALRRSRNRIAEQIRQVRASRAQAEWLFGQSANPVESRDSPLFLFGERLRDGPPQQRSRPFINLASDEEFDYPLPHSERRPRSIPPQVSQDTLVEMEVERIRERRRQAAAPAAPPPLQRQPTVIDLTEEPDSPEQPSIALPDQPRFSRPYANTAPRRQHQEPLRNHSQGRNPRRQMSQLGRTPSLARSDGSILGPAAGGAQVIDLTEDTPNVPQPHQDGLNQPGPGHRNQGNHEAADGDEVAILGFFRRFTNEVQNGPSLFGGGLGVISRLGELGGQVFARQPAEVDVEIIGHNPLPPFPPNLDNPLVNNPVHFNYQANGFNRYAAAVPPKPAHVPPTPAKPGFTRATGDDLAVICPSCEQELKYDPNAGEPITPPAKRARTRKDREEHHFWAVKACGHVSCWLPPARGVSLLNLRLLIFFFLQVYCKSCYENRRPTAKSPKTGFRPSDTPRKVLCAVEDCDSEVANKGSWVGLFL